MVEKPPKAEKKQDKKSVSPTKPRSAYIKKEYYRNQLEQMNKEEKNRSITPKNIQNGSSTNVEQQMSEDLKKEIMKNKEALKIDH